MADETPSVITQALALMREGKVQEADNLLSEHTLSLAQTAAAAGASPPPAPPRTLNQVLYDFLAAIARHFGNRPDLVALLKELEALMP